MKRNQALFEKYVDYTTLTLLILLSILLISLNSEKNNQLKHLRASSLTVIGTIEDQLNAVDDYFELKSENDSLKNEIAELKYNISKYNSAYFELIKLKQTINLTPNETLSFIFAEVIGKHDDASHKSIQINKGEADGIFINDAVIYKNGLVGKVSHIADSYAIIQLANDLLFEVSARIERLGEIGTIKWDGFNRYKLDYIAKSIKLIPGDVVITSGLSPHFPKYIKIGVVETINSDISGLFFDIDVLPSVNFNELEYVNVIRRDSLNRIDKLLLEYNAE